MANIFIKGNTLLSSKDLSPIYNSSIGNGIVGVQPNRLADKNFDLNSQWTGIKVATDNTPKNGYQSWGIYFDFELDGFNRIQMFIGYSTELAVRAYGGGSVWTKWTKIGGVLSSLLSHLVPRKVACLW